MNDTRQHIQPPQEGAIPSAPNKKSYRWVKWIAITLGCLILVPLLLLVAFTIFLTPDRLTSLVNREASQYLNADIHASNVDYTLWSTFPRLKITTGPLTVKSRTLQEISTDIRKQLPDSADFLGSINSFSGEINVVDLFMNRYVVHDVKIDGLKVNLVAYNDSINNYDIIPSSGMKMKRVPYIRINHVLVKNAGTLSYYSASTDTKAKISLALLNLERVHGRRIPSDTYSLKLGGNVTASSSGLRILHNFPIGLDGKMHLRFNPFGIEMSDFGIDLGVIHSRLTMSVGVGDDPSVETFDYRISNVSLASLLGYIPREFIPPMQGLRADMQVNASATLLSAWSFSSETFPSISVKFQVPQGNIAYTTMLPQIAGEGAHSAKISLTHSPIVCDFIFNGEKPKESYIRVSKFNVAGEGVNVGIDALITRLTTHPHVALDLDLRADVARTINSVNLLPETNARGKVNLTSKMNFDIADLTKAGIMSGLKNLTTSAKIDIPDLEFNAPKLKMKGKLSDLLINIEEYTANVSSEYITNPTLSLKAMVGKGNVSVGGENGSVSGLSLTASSSYTGSKTPAELRHGVPIKLQGSLKSAEYASPVDSVNVRARDVTFSDDLHNHACHSFSDLLSDGLIVKIADASVSVPRNSLDMSNINLAMSLAQRGGKIVTAESQNGSDKDMAEDVSDDAGALPHTPTLIKFSAPQGLKNFIRQYSLYATAKVGMVRLLTKGLHADNYLSNINVKINDDSFEIANLYADIENTRGNIRAKISDLRSFLLNPASEKNPLRGSLDIAVDTININALAHAYVVSRGGMKNIPRHDTVTASDSTSLLLPRNLAIALNLTAKETLYTNLEFYNLDADIGLRNGILDIPYLGLATDFGKASLKVNYQGARAEDLGLRLGVDIQDIDIVKFFKKFHHLLEMMPAMENLSGFISADIDVNTEIYPDMYLNIPSVGMNATIEGRGLTVHQSHFIRKITKMMLITTDEDIHIKNMDVHVSAHDNLLQLDPFNFEFDRYKLRMLGVNNFNGELYYHIAVEKSPVPFPFSINIEGMFHHPQLRFGGEHFDEKHAERITSQIQEENKMNMTKVLKQLLRAFIGKAAESAESTK